MKKKKVEFKLLSVKGHQLYEQSIKTQGIERAIEILYNVRRDPRMQMVGVVDENGRQHLVGNVIPMEKLEALNRTPLMSSWDHLTIGMLLYKVKEDPSKHVVQVNARDPIYVLIGKGDVVLDPLMNQVFPPVRQQTHSAIER